MSLDIFSILQEAGASPINRGNYIICKAVWRGGDGFSTAIYLDTQTVKDFVTNQTYSLPDFLKKLTDKDFVLENIEVLKNNNVIEVNKSYGLSILKKLKKDHKYWINRGIRKEIIEKFNGGIAPKNTKYEYRYVLPILNIDGTKIDGFAARDLLPPQPNAPFPRPKWKIGGNKGAFSIEYYTKNEILKTESVLLVESWGDFLKLYNYGIKNTLILFGIDLGAGNLSSILKLDPRRIIIGLNNDNNKEKKTGAGNKNAWKIKRKLCKYFDESQLIIGIPENVNDFGEMVEEQVLAYKLKYNL